MTKRFRFFLPFQPCFLCGALLGQNIIRSIVGNVVDPSGLAMQRHVLPSCAMPELRSRMPKKIMSGSGSRPIALGLSVKFQLVA